MDDLIQLLRVTAATEVQKRWRVTDGRLDELVRDNKIPVYGIREKRIRPDDGKTVYFCGKPCFTFYEQYGYGNDGYYVLEGAYFNTIDVEVFEAEHPELLWALASEDEELEIIPAEEVRKQLAMSPIQFVDMLNGNKGPRLVTSWEEWFRADNIHCFETSQLEELTIHRSDLQEYLQERVQHLEKVPSRAPDGNIDFAAVLKPSYAEIEAQLAEAQAIIVQYKANEPQGIDFNDALTQDSPENILALFSMGDEETAGYLIREKDARIAELGKELAALKEQLASAQETQPAAKDNTAEIGSVDSGRWAASTAAACRAIIEVCRSGRTDWVSGQNSAGTKDRAGDETFNALLSRMNEGRHPVLTQAERAAWSALSKAGLTWTGGRKPSKQNPGNPTFVEGEGV
ncbi:hypothetical protein LJC59_08660 [Desulfovibrio sp. OttesenSCG-928-A18]|nr:hypothetical protein [Desulfovibrio sp. OttesenSCG-928-A18]